MNKEFKGYPTRQIRLSDKEWEELKRQKQKSAKTWNNFIKQTVDILNKNAKSPINKGI